MVPLDTKYFAEKKYRLNEMAKEKFTLPKFRQICIRLKALSFQTWTFNKDMQHGHAGLHLKDMQHAMQHECTAGQVSKDMQH